MSPHSSIHISDNTSSSSFSLYSADVDGTETYASCQASDGLRTSYARSAGYTSSTYLYLDLLDVVLPRMDGLSVLRKLREARHSTPVIIVSPVSSEK